MNVLKRFSRMDNTREDDELEDVELVGLDSIDMNIPTMEKSEVDAMIEGTKEKEPVTERKTVNPVKLDMDKRNLMLLQPKKGSDAFVIADTLKEGKIILLDTGKLEYPLTRLTDFLAGVCYLLSEKMYRLNENTIILAPSDVDISGFAQNTNK